MRFDHIGVFVPSLEEGRRHLEGLLGVTRWTEPVDDPGLRVFVQFGLDDSGVRYELVAPNGEKNPVSGALARGANLLNHVAYRVEDLESAMARLRAGGAMPLGPPRPARAFDGASVVFYLTPLRFVVELIGPKGAPRS
jgi:methylmalonyl-CoA/ethylmalonyl-CoA epimerase